MSGRPAARCFGLVRGARRTRPRLPHVDALAIRWSMAASATLPGIVPARRPLRRRSLGERRVVEQSWQKRPQLNPRSSWLGDCWHSAGEIQRRRGLGVQHAGAQARAIGPRDLCVVVPSDEDAGRSGGMGPGSGRLSLRYGGWGHIPSKWQPNGHPKRTPGNTPDS